MKTKIVYCLVSNFEDYYYEQLLISLCSLRRHNPDAIVEVVCDKDTFATLKDTRSTIYDYNIIVTPIETPGGWHKKEKSRYIKTNLRKLVRGDYLFIDTDTVICSSLKFIDSFSYDIAAVRDSHVERPLPRYSRCSHETEHWIWQNARKANIDIKGLWHFNSGVMYVRDTEITYELYNRWSKHYSEQLHYGVNVDQLPLLLSNSEMGNVISSLDSKMNCQVSFEEGRNNVNEAIIIHYFPRQQKTLLSSPWILSPIKDTGRLNSSILFIIDEPQKFFSDLSRVVVGREATLLCIPSLIKAYMTCPKVFNAWMATLNAYLNIKNCVYRLHNIMFR